MNNPCELCIVRAICREACDGLTAFVTSLGAISVLGVDYIARQLRKGRFTVDHNQVIRRISDDKSMHYLPGSSIM